MKSFHFDLLATQRQVLWLRATVLVLGLAALGAVLAYYQTTLYPEVHQQRAQLQQALAKLGSATPTATMKPVDLEQAWQRARGVSAQLSLPWQNFFSQLGSAAQSGNVAFISIEPDAQKGHVVLVAEARTLQAMLQFLSELQSSPDFSQVVLQAHTIEKSAPERQVRFRMSATWRTTE